MVAAAICAMGTMARADDTAGLVVLSAEGIALTPGDVIPADQPVDLSNGQAVSLIAPSGRIVDLTGPFSGLPMPGGQTRDVDVLDSLKGLIRERVADTGELGATRMARIALPEPWVVDVNASGRRCLREGASVVLWRADANQELPVTLSTRQGAWKARAVWPADEPRLFAPSAIPAEDGDRLTVAFPGGQADLDIAMLPASLSTDAARLAWMIEVGCDDQAVALARRLP